MGNVGRRAILATTAIVLLGGAGPFPIKNSKTAIALAKKICAKQIASHPPVTWNATEINGVWLVDSSYWGPYVDQSMSAHIPVKGPMPARCLSAKVIP